MSWNEMTLEDARCAVAESSEDRHPASTFAAMQLILASRMQSAAAGTPPPPPPHMPPNTMAWTGWVYSNSDGPVIFALHDDNIDALASPVQSSDDDSDADHGAARQRRTLASLFAASFRKSHVTSQRSSLRLTLPSFTSGREEKRRAGNFLGALGLRLRSRKKQCQVGSGSGISE